MKADTLKKSILQWAIEGKLVPQLESEPEVSQIGEAPEDVPFAIPEKWKWVKLDFVVNLENGDRGSNYPAKSKLTTKNTGLPFVSAINLQNNKISTKNLLYLTDKQFSQLRSGHIKSGDCLYCIRGSIGKFGFADADGGAIASSLIILRVKKYISREYFNTVLSSSCIKNQIQYSKNGSAQPNLGAKVFAGFLIPLPPLEEQHRIVAKLNELLPLVETYGKEQEALENLEKVFPDKLRASLLQEAIQGKLVPQLESEPEVEQIGDAPEDMPFEIPEKWKWVNLHSTLKAISDGSHNPPPNVGHGVPVLSAKNVVNGIIDTSSVTRWTTEEQWSIEDKKIHIQSGDVLLTIVGTIGRTAVVPNDCEKFMLQRSVCVMKPKECVNPKFLALILNSPSLFEWIMDHASGTAQKGIYLKTVKQIPIPLPSIEEQRRIVAKLNELLGSISQLEQTISTP